MKTLNVLVASMTLSAATCIGSAAFADPILPPNLFTGNFNISVWNENCGSCAESDPSQQALPTNPMTLTTPLYTGIYSGDLNFQNNAPYTTTTDIYSFLTSAGGSLSSNPTYLQNDTLSTDNFGVVTLIEISGNLPLGTTFQGATVQHDDGASLYANGNPVAVFDQSYPTSLETSPSFDLTGDFTLWYVEANSNPADLVVGYNSFSGPLGKVGTTPIPGALPLFAGGLGMIGLIAGRKKRKVAAAVA